MCGDGRRTSLLSLPALHLHPPDHHELTGKKRLPSFHLLLFCLSVVLDSLQLAVHTHSSLLFILFFPYIVFLLILYCSPEEHTTYTHTHISFLSIPSFPSLYNIPTHPSCSPEEHTTYIHILPAPSSHTTKHTQLRYLYIFPF